MSKRLFQNLMCLFLCVIALLLFKITYEHSIYASAIDRNTVIKTKDYYENEKEFNINVLYPKFINMKIDAYPRLYVSNYIKEFKKRADTEKEYLRIDYKVSFLKDNLIINLSIDDTTNPKIKNKSFIVDTRSGNKIKNIDFLKKQEISEYLVKDKLNKKYSKSVNEELQKTDIDDTSVSVSIVNNKIIVTFNDIKQEINYVPYVEFNMKNNTKEYVYKELENNRVENKKYIALTFDDGPGEATNTVIDALSNNNSKATFFVLGSRVKYYEEIMLRQVALGNEIGSHTYSHKNLVRLSKKELESEINSTNIIYKQVTNKDITLLRPPYGAINENLKKTSMFPLITWNVDTEDWLKRDANKIADHVLNNVKDGDIVLMHDIYSETAEAVKIMVPELIEKGYTLVTVSELAKIKGVTLEKGKVYRSFN